MSLRCERGDCKEEPIVYLDGRLMLCWDHYCETMRPNAILERLSAPVSEAEKEGK